MDSRSAQQIDWPEQQSRRSDDMTRNQGAGGKPAGATGGWKASLAAVLKAHNGARHDGAVGRFATRTSAPMCYTPASSGCTSSISA